MPSRNPCHRPLMVGSEQPPCTEIYSPPSCHRPLMVGSEQLRLLPNSQHLSRHQPLMVGSERTPKRKTKAWVTSHRPLMVGSERGHFYRLDGNTGMSPSPHGRVGTFSGLYHMDSLVMSPSPHGRVGTINILMPSKCPQKSPSPHGRVGTMAFDFDVAAAAKVTVPSWSGRNCAILKRERAPLSGRRPLMVGSERTVLQVGAGWAILVAVPSWSGRNEWSSWRHRI